MLTQAQIALVQNSFAVVAPIADDAAALSYRRLFEIDPTLKAMFKGDMAEQRRKLMQMLAAAVKGLNHIDRLMPVVEDLGRRHVNYGVEEQIRSTRPSARSIASRPSFSNASRAIAIPLPAIAAIRAPVAASRMTTVPLIRPMATTRPFAAFGSVQPGHLRPPG